MTGHIVNIALKCIEIERQVTTKWCHRAAEHAPKCCSNVRGLTSIVQKETALIASLQAHISGEPKTRNCLLRVTEN